MMYDFVKYKNTFIYVKYMYLVFCFITVVPLAVFFDVELSIFSSMRYQVVLSWFLREIGTSAVKFAMQKVYESKQQR
jgi:hypothetical protein